MRYTDCPCSTSSVRYTDCPCAPQSEGWDLLSYLSIFVSISMLLGSAVCAVINWINSKKTIFNYKYSRFMFHCLQRISCGTLQHIIDALCTKCVPTGQKCWTVNIFIHYIMLTGHSRETTRSQWATPEKSTLNEKNTKMIKSQKIKSNLLRVAKFPDFWFLILDFVCYL